MSSLPYDIINHYNFIGCFQVQKSSIEIITECLIYRFLLTQKFWGSKFPVKKEEIYFYTTVFFTYRSCADNFQYSI